MLAAGVNVTVDQDGYHSFDSRYTIEVGQYMFFRLADALICERTADPFTLDEWARYAGSLLKPIVLKWGKERIHCFIEMCMRYLRTPFGRRACVDLVLLGENLICIL